LVFIDPSFGLGAPPNSSSQATGCSRAGQYEPTGRNVILAIMPTLAVVGAGPKGIATASKARAPDAAGLGAPRVVLIDRGAAAGLSLAINACRAGWSAQPGYRSSGTPGGRMMWQLRSNPGEADVDALQLPVSQRVTRRTPG
jgi:hypothetical protein